MYLRLGRFDRAIEDGDTALALDPRRAWALYGRGLAREHLGQTAAGQADTAAAEKLLPGISAEATRCGIVP